jgi:hypothetical protein
VSFGGIVENDLELEELKRIAKIPLEETQDDVLAQSIAAAGMMLAALEHVSCCICAIYSKKSDPNTRQKRLNLAEFFYENLNKKIESINRDEHLC